MPTAIDVLRSIEEIAPERWALSDDKVGLLVGDPGGEIGCAAVSLDWSMELADFAESFSANLLVVHHPVIWDPIARLTSQSLRGLFLQRLASRGISAIASHTNWDAAPGGVSDTMASLLGLRNVRPLSFGAKVRYCKLVAFAPEDAVDGVLQALSDVGAGRLGNYERCAFRSQGVGTFRGLPGSNPAVGKTGQIEQVPEVRLEMRLPEALQDRAVAALRLAHPYEEPAFDIYPLEPAVEMPLSRIGELADPTTLSALQRSADAVFGTRSQCWGDSNKNVRKVAVAGGAADDGWAEALEAGADAMVTGEVKQHVGLEASGNGLGMIASGHYGTEHPGCAALRDRLAAMLPEIDWRLFEPPPGIAGRPL